MPRPALSAVLLCAGLTLPPPLPAAAEEGYRLRAGDSLRIEVIEDAGLNRTVLVAPDGRIAVPLAGALTAAGRTVDQVQTDLTARLRPSFAAAPNVYVSLERLGVPAAGAAPGPGPALRDTIAVYVVGEAGRTGKLELEAGATLLQAISEMGGFTAFAARKRVQLQRGQDRYPVDYVAIESGRSRAGATVMADGDVIVVPQRRLFE